MPQKPALLLLAVVGAQFTAGGVHLLSLVCLAFDLAVLYPLLAWLAKSDPRAVEVFAESLAYRSFYMARPELRRPQARRPLSAVVR
jgi:type IV secretory pathway TrbD component